MPSDESGPDRRGRAAPHRVPAEGLEADGYVTAIVSDGPSEQTVLRAGDVALDLRTRRAIVDGRTVELTAREYALLELFLRHADQVLSREQLLSHVWGYDFDPGSNVVEVYVGYLRRKLGPDHLDTVRGMGYRLRVAPG